MSVDRAAYIGLGWIIDIEEREQMLDYCAQHYPSEVGAVEDILCNYVDAYSGDGPVFVGDIFGFVGEGWYKAIEDFIPADFDSEVFAEKYMEIFELCGIDVAPGSKWEEAKLYVVNSIT